MTELVLLGVVAGEFVFDILRHLFGVDSFHDVVPFSLGEFANKIQDCHIKSDHRRTVDE